LRGIYSQGEYIVILGDKRGGRGASEAFRRYSGGRDIFLKKLGDRSKDDCNRQDVNGDNQRPGDVELDRRSEATRDHDVLPEGAPGKCSRSGMVQRHEGI
jgi:hypothetical protein